MATSPLPIWQGNGAYRQAVLCAPSKGPLEFLFVATCCTDEFKLRSRCCSTPISLCLRLRWTLDSLISRPSTEASASSWERRPDNGEEPMRQCVEAYKWRADG